MYSITDIKSMTNAQLEKAAEDIRSQIIAATAHNGGHPASNLGAVELTVALHCVFDSPRDKIVFDVGHQAYTHKLLTGRSLEHLRTADGTGGFPDPEESEHDQFAVGHSATAVSTALGLARARDILKEDYSVIAVVGDGAFGGGMNLEAVNDLGYNKTRLIIVLNDNGMSISRNVGAIAGHLVRLRTAKGYVGLKRGLERFLKAIPFAGRYIFKAALKIKNIFRYILIGNTVFDNMGIKYIGSVDGHNIAELKSIFKRAREETVPVVIHVRTVKGRGDARAEHDPTAYHGVTAAGQSKTGNSFTSYFADWIVQKGKEDGRVCAVTAGMTDSTGLREFAKELHERFFDVGIAEQHALGMSAGLAKGGMRPFAAIYSTFLQRAADQIFQELELQKLPVVLCIDRAGFVGQDGRTHQGAYDIAILRSHALPIMAPANGRQLWRMLELASNAKGPCAVRYPKGDAQACSVPEKTEFGKWQLLEEGADAAIIAFGALLPQALGARKILLEKGIEAAVINACFIEPVDTEMLRALRQRIVCVAEDNAAPGGLGEAAAEYVHCEKYISLTGEKAFSLHDSVAAQQRLSGLDAKGIAAAVLKEAETQRKCGGHGLRANA